MAARWERAAASREGQSSALPSEPEHAARGFSGTSEEEFRACLYAPDMHDPDLIIRTSGEQRLSNYLLWQSAYSELVFRDELWPDFGREAFEASLAEFAHRRRRFGRRSRAADGRTRARRPCRWPGASRAAP